MARDEELQNTLEDGDDLFDFDELIEGAEQVVDELSNELDEAISASEDAQAEEPEPETPPEPKEVEPVAEVVPAPAYEGPDLAPEPLPQIEPAASDSAASYLERFRAPGKWSTRIPIVAASLAVLTLANLALVGLTWKSLDTTQELIAAGAARSAGAPSPATTTAPNPAPVVDATPRAADTSARLPLEDPPLEAYATLFDAETALERGEHKRARRTLYGLLAVIDRVPAEDRSDVEARAGYLVAESYRLQARDVRPGGDE